MEKSSNEYIRKFDILLNNSKLKFPQEENFKSALNKIKQLAKKGYLLPNDETMEDHWNFLRNIDNEAKLNELFINYFECDNNFEKLIERFNNNEAMNKFYDLYNQAIHLLEKEMFSGSLIILSVLYEGTVREFVNYADGSDVSSNINSFLNKKYTNKNRLIYQDREEIKIFTKIFFKKVNFDNMLTSDYFNRNVLLHGIDYSKISKVDVLKILNAIDILIFLLSEHKNILEVKKND